jgi:hypothetical protein
MESWLWNGMLATAIALPALSGLARAGDRADPAEKPEADPASTGWYGIALRSGLCVGDREGAR